VLFLSLASAVQNQNKNQVQAQNQINSSGIGQELGEQIAERKAEIREGNYTTSQGQLLQVREIVAGLKEMRTDNKTAKTEMNTRFAFTTH